MTAIIILEWAAWLLLAYGFFIQTKAAKRLKRFIKQMVRKSISAYLAHNGLTVIPSQKGGE